MSFLREARENCGLSIHRVEKITKISNQWLYGAEGGEILSPGVRRLVVLAKLYQVPPIKMIEKVYGWHEGFLSE